MDLNVPLVSTACWVSNLPGIGSSKTTSRTSRFDYKATKVPSVTEQTVKSV